MPSAIVDEALVETRLVDALAAARLSLDLGAPVLEQLIVRELMRTSGSMRPCQ